MRSDSRFFLSVLAFRAQMGSHLATPPRKNCRPRAAPAHNVRPTTTARRDAERRAAEKIERDALPVLLVDLTAIDPGVHNRADKHAVNDPSAASAMRRRIESEYAAFAAEHASDGVAVATTRGAHLAKLRSLRDETPGHYWVACFPP